MQTIGINNSGRDNQQCQENCNFDGKNVDWLEMMLIYTFDGDYESGSCNDGCVYIKANNYVKYNTNTILRCITLSGSSIGVSAVNKSHVYVLKMNQVFQTLKEHHAAETFEKEQVGDEFGENNTSVVVRVIISIAIVLLSIMYIMLTKSMLAIDSNAIFVNIILITNKLD